MRNWTTALLWAALGAPAAGLGATEPEVGQYEVFEVTLTSDAKLGNPFTEPHVMAEFQGPGGRVAKVPGFHYGGDAWMVRFAPDQPGRWLYRARLLAGKSEVEKRGAFRCVVSSRRGFVRISKRNPYRFEYDNGEPFYPLGVQSCGYARPDLDGPNPDGSWRTVAPETWNAAFAGAVNLVRWQLSAGTKAGCARPLIPVGGPADRYDTNLARELDEILKGQRAAGFAHVLVPFQDMSLWGKDETAFGRVDDVAGYKSLKAPNLPLQEQYLRYVVARYASMVDIWELFNEDSVAPADYLARLAEVVREADPYRHPITTNYTRSAEPWCEISTWHGYMRLDAGQVDRWVAAQAGKYKSYGKPVLNTEFGNKGSLSNVDPVKWRVAVWTAFLNETNILFWNMSGIKTQPRPQGNANAYLGPDSRQHFRVFQEFTRDLPMEMRPVECSYAYHDEVNLYALSNGRTAVLYVHHFADHTKPYAREGRVYLHTGAGHFRIRCIDPADGRVVRTGRASTAQQYLFFELPPVTIDLACRLDLEE